MGRIVVSKRKIAVVAIAALIGCVPLSARAAGLIDVILSVFGAPPPAASPIQQVPPNVASAPLRILISARRSSEFSGVAGYCVRLCDGLYFPLPRLNASSATPVRLCNSLCPGSRTMVYWGAPIDEARSSNGTRYSDLTTAFDYRKHTVANCTCNGTDNFGTAAVSIREDISLRPGDIVVTEYGVKVFIGSARWRHEASDFSSLQNYSGFSVDHRRTLSKLQITRRPPLKTGQLNFNTRIVFGASPQSSSLIPPANVAYPK
jgi:hypothetical protein